MNSSAFEFLCLTVRAQETAASDSAFRSPIREALDRAARGDELSLFDIPENEAEFKKEFARALRDVVDEQKRRRRAAASILALKRIRGEAPR